jgi:hypothetical protein
MHTKSDLIDALSTFISHRPGLAFGNYGDVSAYRSELRSIVKDLHHARELLQAVAWRDSITADDIIAATQGGRLHIEPNARGFRIDYTTGQYFPTEYRRAVASLLSTLLWNYWRDDMAEPTGDKIRATARRNLSRSVARRWFN